MSNPNHPEDELKGMVRLDGSHLSDASIRALQIPRADFRPPEAKTVAAELRRIGETELATEWETYFDFGWGSQALIDTICRVSTKCANELAELLATQWSPPWGERTGGVL